MQNVKTKNLVVFSAFSAASAVQDHRSRQSGERE
jgi:hypothetical protein